MSRRSIFGIVILILALLAVFGFRQLAAGNRSTTSDLETAVVERGTLIALVSASGTVEARRQVALTFKAPGQVAQVYVEAGDVVAAGALLAKLNTSELELQVAQARAGLASAEAQLAQLTTGPRSQDVAAAQAALDSALAQLEKLQAGPHQEDVQAARAALDSARKNFSKILAGPSQFELDQAKRNLDQARNQLYSAQSQRDGICGRVDLSLDEALARQIVPASQAQCDQAQAQVLIAEVAVDQAAATLEELKAPTDGAAVAAAQAQVAQAQAQLGHLLEGAGAAELAAAQAQVRQAEAQLEKLRAGPTAEELAVAEAQVEQARVGVLQAELALQNATLVAPMAGTVATVGVAAGELVSAARPAVVLINTSEFKIVLAIDETDVGQIQRGQPATIALDAFPGEKLTGQVAEVLPAATIQQGIVTYGVTVRPDPTDLPLRPGMTAGVDIVVAEHENVLLVPNRAVRTQQGKRVVLVPRGNETMAVEVETGLRNEQFVEIKSGLSEGDRVVTSVVPSNNPLEGGFFGR
ncbi:MAG: efflux RND transporter periplasmic adaptor subunit [Anaerolineae bacterium]